MHRIDAPASLALAVAPYVTVWSDGIVNINSAPEPVLAASSLAALAVAMTLPFTPVGAWFGFVAPPPIMLAAIGVLVVVYLACAELLKPLAVQMRHPR